MTYIFRAFDDVLYLESLFGRNLRLAQLGIKPDLALYGGQEKSTGKSNTNYVYNFSDTTNLNFTVQGGKNCYS